MFTALSRPDLCGYRLRFDTFLDCLMIAEGVGGGSWRELTEDDYFALAMVLESGSVGFTPIPDALVRSAAIFTCGRNKFDTAQDWLNGLTWDGVHRVGDFLTKYFGAADTEYARAVSFYWWSALAGRVLFPGVKADMAVIAVGEQGKRKTTAVYAMAPSPDFCGELDLADDATEKARKMRGKLIMELGEMSGFAKRTVQHLKAFVSRQAEEWTPKYKEFAKSVPRRCLFFGTTNDQEILVDETGNRRWLPFNSSGADPEGIAAVRDQLWAEGAHLFRQHGVMWQDSERLARDEQQDFAVTDPWDSAIETWLTTLDPFENPSGKKPADGEFTIGEVLSDALSIPPRQQDRAAETRAGRVLRRFGFFPKQRRIPGGKGRIRTYSRSEV